MNILLRVAAMVACAFCLEAQLVTSLNRTSEGSTEIKIRNNSALALTAFSAAANVTIVNQGGRKAVENRPPLMAGFDTAITSSTESLAPGQERSLLFVSFVPDHGGCSSMAMVTVSSALLQADQKRRNIINRSGSPCELGEPVTAAIFADGSTTGDSGLLAKLMLRRSNTLLAVETTLEMLSDAGRRNVPREQLIVQFKRMVDSLQRWYLPPEQKVGLDLYQSMIGKLINLPPTKNDEPFPPNEFVERESATLRDRRVSLMESQSSLAYTFSVAAPSSK